MNSKIVPKDSNSAEQEMELPSDQPQEMEENVEMKDDSLSRRLFRDKKDDYDPGLELMARDVSPEFLDA